MLALVALPLALVGGAARGGAVASRPATSSSRTRDVVMYWHIFPRTRIPDGLQWEDKSRTSFDGTTALVNEYNVEPGQQQALGCYDFQGGAAYAPGVDPAQCVVQVAEDGSCVYAYAQGQQQTGWRTRPDEPWTWMQPGESIALQTGWKISLDVNNPESAVYKFEKAGRFLVAEYLDAQARKTGTGQYAGMGGGMGGGQLPFGWTQAQDPQTGQTYYYNQQTGQTSWEFPRQ